MHSLSQRAQNVFSYFSSVAVAVAIAVALSVLVQPQTPKAALQLKNVQVVTGRPHYYSKKREEYAHVRFDLDADLSSLFHWNTKQIFAYVTASYPSSSPDTIPPSEIVIWDAVIPASNAPFHANTYVHPEGKSMMKVKSRTSKQKKGLAWPAGTQPGILRLFGQKPKYQITDISGKIAERQNATLTLHWNIQPWVGAMVWTNRQTIGRWQGLQGGQSKAFDFPALKTADTKKEDLKTERGAEARRGKPS
ncbi:hypothetical protein AMS68_007714 [Peltaster fructicola]|uniref:Signal peptidase subunit 3 n=1 Tax=Peltaster fructicola TaxID=286661 RepID=A0A6H0Y576_9PEZI|nr:hypothetical protein AMS68_007714 [Peltaster fructicola]